MPPTVTAYTLADIFSHSFTLLDYGINASNKHAHIKKRLRQFTL